MVQQRNPNLSTFGNAFSLISTTYKSGGYPAFFGGKTGAIAAVQRQMVMNSVKIGCYEPVRKFYYDLLGVPEESGGLPVKCVKILSGCTTGFLAVIVGQPTDVVKVRMQAEPGRYKSSLQGIALFIQIKLHYQ